MRECLGDLGHRSSFFFPVFSWFCKEDFCVFCGFGIFCGGFQSPRYIVSDMTQIKLVSDLTQIKLKFGSLAHGSNLEGYVDFIFV